VFLIKDRIDTTFKIIDALYKKLIILVAIAGGFGAYAISFLRNNSIYGYIFAIVFIVVSISIFITYYRFNIYIKEMEKANE
jgi:membrane protein YdbS with pleckstrin-like domain